MSSVASNPKRPRADTPMAVERIHDIAANLSIPPFQPILVLGLTGNIQNVDGRSCWEERESSRRVVWSPCCRYRL